MAALGDDCYFFCTSTCAKGAACPFRHVEAAKTCRIICQHWQMGGCLRPMCKFRHSDFVLQIDVSEVPCFWESQPTGCIKKNCAYKHSKPRPQVEAAALVNTSAVADNPKEGTAPSEQDAVTSQKLLQPASVPVVSAVVIQPSVESEDSNSSSVKRAPGQESCVQVSEIKQKDEADALSQKKIEDSSSPSIQKANVKKKMKKPAADVKAKKNIAVKKKVQKKIAGGVTANKKKIVATPRKSAKDRLGQAPVLRPEIRPSPSPSESDNESCSDSDDSIENIKVMSMEEILRQKALESMMKKRDAESKTALTGGKKGDKNVTRWKTPVSVTAGKKPIAERKAPFLDTKVRKQAAKFKKAKPVSPSESSLSSEEELSEEDVAIKQSSEDSSSGSSSPSSSSAGSSSDSDEDSADDSEEIDVRRVVVDVESEKAARKRAKESFLRKQKQNIASTQSSRSREKVIRPLVSQAKQQPMKSSNKAEFREPRVRRRRVDVDYDSDDIASSRVKKPLKPSVRDRLGKSPAPHKTSSDARLFSRGDKSRPLSSVWPVINKTKEVPKVKVVQKPSSSSSEDDHDSLSEVKIKTLEEIKQEKLRKLAAEQNNQNSTQEAETVSHKPLPVKQRLGKITDEDQNKEPDNLKSRQVVLITDTGSKSDDTISTKPLDEQKRLKKRPWRSQKSGTSVPLSEAVTSDDKRMAEVASHSAEENDYSKELNRYKEDQGIDESPFEKLRRRALMKKLQAEERKKAAFVEEEKIVKADSETEITGAADESRSVMKTDKHKHRHKHHKKVKTERQIYMPPAMKNTTSKPTCERVSPKRETVIVPESKVSPLKREPHPIAAAWAAGLSLSSKGIGVRRPEPIPVENSGIVSKIQIADKIKVKDSAPKVKDTVPSIKTSQPVAESSAVTIKSFSEIMAEKRKRRLEMQGQKSGTTNVSASPTVGTSSTPTTLPVLSQPDSSQPKPRVPISPIVFTSDNSSGIAQKTLSQADSITSITAAVQSIISTPMEVTAGATVTSTPAVAAVMTPSVQHSTKTPVDHNRLTSAKKHSINNGDKSKNSKKLFSKKTVTAQSDVISEDNNNMSSFSSSLVQPESMTSFSAETLSQSSRISNDSTMLKSTSLNRGPSFPHPLQQNSSHKDQDVFENKSDTKMSTSNVKTETPTNKHSSSLFKTDAEPAKKKTRLSIEDEFNFFVDEDFDVEDGFIPESIEPIDDLLQDIDNLLS